MRYIIYGAGAIGGTIGARLFQHGYDVLLIALDVGRYPSGVDETIRETAQALSASNFSCRAVPDVMRRKYARLLSNLANALGVLCEKRAVDGKPRPGSSSWQSIARGTGSIETDYLNG